VKRYIIFCVFCVVLGAATASVTQGMAFWRWMLVLALMLCTAALGWLVLRDW
jgi:hypothetical protein